MKFMEMTTKDLEYNINLVKKRSSRLQKINFNFQRSSTVVKNTGNDFDVFLSNVLSVTVPPSLKIPSSCQRWLCNYNNSVIVLFRALQTVGGGDGASVLLPMVLCSPPAFHSNQPTSPEEADDKLCEKDYFLVPKVM